MEQMKLWKLNLRLFGEGGGEAGGGAGAAGTAEAAGAQAAPLDEGQNQQPAQTIVTEKTAQERAAAFEQLIKGEYAKEFHDRAQGIFNERFKETKNLEKQLEGMKPLMDALATKYGVTDHDKLMAAIEADESFYQAAADEQGLSVEQYKHMRELERKAAAFDEAEKQRQRVDTERRAYAVWDQQSQQLKQVYPGFDFAAECQNPQTGQQFIKLLGNGVDVRTAYEVLHKDELLSGAIQTAVQQAQQRTVQTIQAQGMRPAENGVGSSVATQMTKIDPSRMTKKERDDLVRRSLRGERIEL